MTIDCCFRLICHLLWLLPIRYYLNLDCIECIVAADLNRLLLFVVVVVFLIFIIEREKKICLFVSLYIILLRSINKNSIYYFDCNYELFFYSCCKIFLVLKWLAQWMLVLKSFFFLVAYKQTIRKYYSSSHSII